MGHHWYRIPRGAACLQLGMVGEAVGLGGLANLPEEVQTSL
jgi:hypothetical protein